MTDERKQLSKPKKFGYVLLFTLLYSCSGVFLDFIFGDFRLFDPDAPDRLSFLELLMMAKELPTLYIIFFAITVVCSFFMFLLCKKRKFPPLFFIISIAIFFASYSIFDYAKSSTLALYYPSTLFVICILLTSLFILIPKVPPTMKRFAVYSALIFTLLVGIFFSSSFYIKKSMDGEADKTGSWSAINQSVIRADNWKQIVKNSPFNFEKIEESKDEYGHTEFNAKGINYPALDGSTVSVPMAAEFARQHLGLSDGQCNDFVRFSTTHYAYEKLINREEFSTTYSTTLFQPVYVNFPTTDLILATEPSDEELASAKEKGVTLVKKPICYDTFVFITHKDNPVESLTVQQIKDIYSGKIKNWKEVGGKDEKIRAFQREKNSGSQTAMENLVMKGTNMIDPIEVTVIEGMGELIDRVAEYQNGTASLGYTYKYYIDTLYKNENIKTIAVEGIEPTDDNIRGEKYPFWTNYYGVIRGGDEDKTGGKFLDWILSKEGQECVKQAGYIMLK